MGGISAYKHGATDSQENNVVRQIRTGTCRPGISGPIRPGSDKKYDITYLTIDKHYHCSLMEKYIKTKYAYGGMRG